MATISNILNIVSCGLNASLGTGTKGCEAFFKKVSSLWLTQEGFKFDGARTLDEDYIQELQAQGKLIILKGIRTFTDNSEDDVLETLEDGTSQVARLGLYQFALQFINGLYFQAALTSLNSFGAYDAIFVDNENNILGTKASDGSLKGFSVGMLQAMRFSFATDTVGQKQGLTLQLTERSEVDSNYVYIQSDAIAPYEPKKQDGVNEVFLEFTAVPADTDTTISVKASLKQDGSVFTGAAYTDFLLTVDNVTGNPTAGNDSTTPGTYVLTVAAVSTNEVLGISLYDNSNNRTAIELANCLYKSNTASATVTA